MILFVLSYTSFGLLTLTVVCLRNLACAKLGYSVAMRILGGARVVSFLENMAI